MTEPDAPPPQADQTPAANMPVERAIELRSGTRQRVAVQLPPRVTIPVQWGGPEGITKEVVESLQREHALKVVVDNEPVSYGLDRSPDGILEVSFRTSPGNHAVHIVAASQGADTGHEVVLYAQRIRVRRDEVDPRVIGRPQ